MKRGLITGTDGRTRCWWCGDDPEYTRYHDDEWGRPVLEDRLLFEKICLEGFQSGLSWLTILRKREHFRRAFCDFDITQVSRFGPKQIDKLLQNAGIVRHRGKIESTVNNAGRATELIDEFGSLAAFAWQFEAPAGSKPMTHTRLLKLSQTPESKALSKDLKTRGWSYVGPTTAYAFMQAVGIVNDHLDGCDVRESVDKARSGVDPAKGP